MIWPLLCINPQDEHNITNKTCLFVLQDEEGWWEGSVDGKVGMFPSNFVELVDEEETSSSPGNVSTVFFT